MLVLDWLVGEKHDARRERLALDQVKRLLLALLWEEALPAAQDHRKDHQAIFVDEASRVKRVDQLTTAEHQDILTVLLPQSGQCFRQIALEQGGIPGHGRGVFRAARAENAPALQRTPQCPGRRTNAGTGHSTGYHRARSGDAPGRLAPIRYERPGSRPAGSKVWPAHAPHLTIQSAITPTRRFGVGFRERLPARAASGGTHAGARASGTLIAGHQKGERESRTLCGKKRSELPARPCLGIPYPLPPLPPSLSTPPPPPHSA